MTSHRTGAVAVSDSGVSRRVVLMVDDDEEDIYLTRRAFAAGGGSTDFRHVGSGEELFAYLGNEGPYADSSANPCPRLILMDINMPIENGLELLARVRGDPVHAAVPVVMMSTSLSERDVDEAYRLGANSFVTKASTANGTKELVHRIRSFWFDTAIVP